MTPRELADAIAASVRASLRIAQEQGQTIEQFLALEGDRAIAGNAAQHIALAEQLDDIA